MCALAEVLLTAEFGWSCWHGPAQTVWVAGYINDCGRTLVTQAAAKHLANVLQGNAESLSASLRAVDGQFGVVIEEKGRVIAATDRIRSFPIFYAKDSNGRYILDVRARRLLQRTQYREHDKDAGLAVAMSGYTVGPKTLYQGISQLLSGSLAIFSDRPTQVKRYYTYNAWRDPIAVDRVKGQRLLGDVTRHIFEKVVAGLSGRAVMVPLSGGLDSRLIVAGLLEVGYRNVICFAYGRPRNYEANKSREVAEKLGLKWHFIPYSPSKIRAFHKTQLYAEHLAFADTCASVPFIQDVLAIGKLKSRKVVPEDAVFINGQSGDFITGNHIPTSLWVPNASPDTESRREKIVAALIAKHFMLWRDLATPDNLRRISSQINDRINAAEAPAVSTTSDHGIYELIECEERQSKFVVSGQRVYDYFGHDWRLPLWDSEYMDFWEGMPLEFKKGQSLYREWLAEANWGGVWSPLLPVRTIVPAWARWIRAAASVPAKLIGDEFWHALDRRVFTHMTDLLCTVHAVPWREALFDRCGFRHGVSFRSRNYLAMHGLSADGQTCISDILPG